MGGSGAFSKSKSRNQSAFNQDVWEPQGDALGGMYGQLSDLFNSTNSGMQSRIEGAANQMQGIFDQSQPYWQNQMQGGAYNGMDLQGNYQNALQGGGNEQFMNEQIMGGAGNDYVDAMKGQMQADSQQNLNSSLANNDARASAAGMSGSSRQGLTESRIYEDSNDALMDAQTSLGVNSFENDLNRKLGIAQRADQFDMGRLQNTSQMLGSRQGAMQGGLNYGSNMQNLGMGQFSPYNSPWQAAGQYAQGIGGPTVLGAGTSSGRGNSWATSGGGGMTGNKGGSGGG